MVTWLRCELPGIYTTGAVHCHLNQSIYTKWAKSKTVWHSLNLNESINWPQAAAVLKLQGANVIAVL